MDKEYAVKVLYSFRSMVGSELADAIDISIALIKESMVQKPATNSDYAAALQVIKEFETPYSNSNGYTVSQLEAWIKQRLHSSTNVA